MRIIDFFDHAVRYHPANIAFVDGAEQLTYAQADDRVHRIAAALHGHGHCGGTHVGVYSPNSNIAFLALLGLMRAQGIWLPINPRNSVETNIDLSMRFDMEVLFFHSSFAEQTSELLAAVPGIKEAICIDGVADVGIPMKEWLNGQPSILAVGQEQVKELLAVFPTGGTTGKSKGVLMNHKSIETLYANYYSHFKYYEKSVHLVVAPMTHTAGLLGCMHFARGGKNVIAPGTDPEAILRAIDQYGVTHLFLPPTVLYMMLAHPRLHQYDYSSLQHFIVGAAPTSLEKLKEAIDVFGPVMTEAYGQAECPAGITLKAPWDYLNLDGSINEARLRGIGRSGVFNNVTILDEQGRELPRGEAGEISVRGKLVTLGYYKDKQATARSRRDGWLLTGDSGVMDQDGYITIVDRRKDLIITGGFNVYPNEVEQVLSAHPSVQESAVIGVPDEKWGEAVKGVVLLKPDTEVSEEQLIAAVKARLGCVKAPKTIDFVYEFPKSAAGKVLKTELRKPYWKGFQRAVN